MQTAVHLKQRCPITTSLLHADHIKGGVWPCMGISTLPERADASTPHISKPGAASAQADGNLISLSEGFFGRILASWFGRALNAIALNHDCQSSAQSNTTI